MTVSIRRTKDIHAGYMPVEKRYKFHRIYNAYHALGGNGICTDLMKKLEKLPTSRREKCSDVA